MNCPNCNETLVMADRQGVEIDYCPKCRGVWLDRGELDKLIERSSNYTPPMEDNRYRDRDEDYRKQYPQGGGYNQQYPHKKKKGFLGEMFDFD